MPSPSPSHFPHTPFAGARPVPLSPQLDQHNIYTQQQQQSQSSLSASPATSLPRHSRGLDFSRACTNLHHSILAESSPDSSPVILQKAMAIPGRKISVESIMLNSPNINGPGSMPWGSLMPERSTVSSSVGSVNMMASESENSESDEDASMAGDDNEDQIFTTPQVHKLQNPNAPTPFALAPPTTPGGAGAEMWGRGAPFSPAQASLMKTIRRTRLQKNAKRTRKSSSSASGSGYSSMASPRTNSPPPMRSIESAANGGYFNWATAARSRRQSLAMGTDGLHLSSGNDSGDEASLGTPSTPGVVRRPVTRRQNLLPKTKGFARIRAALLEEAAPIDTEVRREAETIRQVRERDGSVSELDLERPQTATGQSSPSLLPAVSESAQEDFGNDLDGNESGLNGNTNGGVGLGMNFAAHASRNSGGLDYWHRFDPSLRTPPPPNFARQSSSVISDINMDSSEVGGNGTPLWRRPRARSSASEASEAFAPNSAAVMSQQQQPAGVNDDMHLKKFKRRREDDFDIATIKRRAVSPGMSAQNSPVLTHSPSQREAGIAWGQPPDRPSQQQQQQQSQQKETALQKESLSQPQSAGSESQNGGMLSQQSSRHGSGGSSISLTSGSTLAPAQGKKLGLQGMVDTNDGLMKMSIE